MQNIRKEDVAMEEMTRAVSKFWAHFVIVTLFATGRIIRIVARIILRIVKVYHRLSLITIRKVWRDLTVSFCAKNGLKISQKRPKRILKGSQKSKSSSKRFQMGLKKTIAYGVEILDPKGSQKGLKRV